MKDSYNFKLLKNQIIKNEENNKFYESYKLKYSFRSNITLEDIKEQIQKNKKILKNINNKNFYTEIIDILNKIFQEKYNKKKLISNKEHSLFKKIMNEDNIECISKDSILFKIKEDSNLKKEISSLKEYSLLKGCLFSIEGLRDILKKNTLLLNINLFFYFEKDFIKLIYLDFFENDFVDNNINFEIRNKIIKIKPEVINCSQFCIANKKKDNKRCYKLSFLFLQQYLFNYKMFTKKNFVICYKNFNTFFFKKKNSYYIVLNF